MTTMKMIFPLSLLSLLLTACGGGGGGGGGGGNSGGSDRQTINNSSNNNATASVAAASTTPAGASPTVAGKPVVTGGRVRAPSSSAIALLGAAAVVNSSANREEAGIVPLVVANPRLLAAASPAVAAATALPSGVEVIPSSSTLPPGVKVIPISSTYSGYFVTLDNGFVFDPSAFTGNSNVISVTVKDNKTNIVLNPKITEGTLTHIGQEITELKDLDSTELLGYYGWATATLNTPETREGTVGEGKYPLLDIFYAMKSASIVPAVAKDQTVQYKGTFLYAEQSHPALRTTGEAVFSYRNKQINGSIHAYNGATTVAHWVVDPRDISSGNNVVDDDGSFSFRLQSKVSTVNDGEMRGGFFGKEGQVMAASAQSTGGTDKSGWAGIFVGKQQPVPER